MPSCPLDSIVGTLGCSTYKLIDESEVVYLRQPMEAAALPMIGGSVFGHHRGEEDADEIHPDPAETLSVPG